jgi:hypothetical protein
MECNDVCVSLHIMCIYVRMFMCVIGNKGINVRCVSFTNWNSRIIMVVVKGNQSMNYVNDKHGFHVKMVWFTWVIII